VVPSLPLGPSLLLLHGALAAAALAGIWRSPGGPERERPLWSAAVLLLPFLGPLLWWGLGRPRGGDGAR
jgi:hypothetical protein